MGMLRAQDILVVLKVIASGKSSFAELGRSLGLSVSQAHSATKRAIQAGLLREDGTVRGSAVLEVLTALRYYMPAERGSEVRGVPTAFSAPVLATEEIATDLRGPVWPHPEGTERGYACSPLYKTAPTAALQDPALYRLLALADALRIGNARERELAQRLLKEAIGI
ncbi:MAG: hypothetical protein SFX74_09585 [Fimbriimonadaceae bacterium]|nr:hypothetical protein [Fimbriimonadaceae bacterium]